MVAVSAFLAAVFAVTVTWISTRPIHRAGDVCREVIEVLEEDEESPR